MQPQTLPYFAYVPVCLQRGVPGAFDNHNKTPSMTLLYSISTSRGLPSAASGGGLTKVKQGPHSRPPLLSCTNISTSADSSANPTLAQKHAAKPYVCRRGV